MARPIGSTAGAIAHAGGSAFLVVTCTPRHPGRGALAHVRPAAGRVRLMAMAMQLHAVGARTRARDSFRIAIRADEYWACAGRGACTGRGERLPYGAWRGRSHENEGLGLQSIALGHCGDLER